MNIVDEGNFASPCYVLVFSAGTLSALVLIVSSSLGVL